MMNTGLVAGRNSAWKLKEKLGEGDAGEVYLVESLLEGRQAILKRPHLGAFPSEIIRQASQIETEGRILRAMENLKLEMRVGNVRSPALLDRSKNGTEFSDRYFIVIELASGFNLNELARAVTLGSPEGEIEVTHRAAEQNILFSMLVERAFVPPLLLLRLLFLMSGFIQAVHKRMLNDEGMMHHGAIWNDIKPDHLFWDPDQSQLILIDWGNSKFLQADGTTKDRQGSVTDDSYQFAQEMGRFLKNFQPALFKELEWPEDLTGAEGISQSLEELRTRIEQKCLNELDELSQIRQQERDLIASNKISSEVLLELQGLQEKIIQHGELPDYSGSEALALNLGTQFVSEEEFEKFGEVCHWAASHPLASSAKWRLLESLSSLGAVPESSKDTKQNAIQQALVAGLVDDWPAAIWSLVQGFADQGVPVWWQEISQEMRRLHFSIDQELLPPYTALSRILYALESDKKASEEGNETPDALPGNQARKRSVLIEIIKTEIIPKWPQIAPEPPDSGLEYREVELILADLGELIPNARLAMLKTLDQPAAQARIVLEAWSRKEFDMARKGLRRMLLWDPHRWRVLSADQAILKAPQWLQNVRLGPPEGEPLGDFMTRLELQGRELRHQIGSAVWMDVILDALQRLRKGARAADLIAENPDLVAEMPWVTRVGWVPVHKVARSAPVKINRVPIEFNNNVTIEGVLESRIGQSQGFLLDAPLDTWAPEARGSSARVFQGFLRNGDGNLKQAAVKLMRPDRVEYALPLFLEETRILEKLTDVQGITGILETGFLKLDRGTQLPPESAAVSARNLKGEVQRYGLDLLEDYLGLLPNRVQKGWVPYLALEKRESDHNLMLLCDAGYTRGRFLPLAEALRIAIQICDIFDTAHQRGIVYRDHKINHFYWQELYNGVFIIDWNVAKYYPDEISLEDKQFDIVQFGARALHHILTGRPAPGALPMGPTRPEEIEAAAHSYRVQWTYDDQRLPDELRNLLEQVLAGTYTGFAELREDLLKAFNHFQGNGLEEESFQDLEPLS